MTQTPKNVTESKMENTKKSNTAGLALKHLISKLNKLVYQFPDDLKNEIIYYNSTLDVWSTRKARKPKKQELSIIPNNMDVVPIEEKEFALDTKKPDKKYNIAQIIHEHGRMKGHIERLEQQVREKNELVQKAIEEKDTKQVLLSQNKASILELLKEHPLTRAELLKLSNVSQARTYSIISELIKSGHITSEGQYLKVKT